MEEQKNNPAGTNDGRTGIETGNNFGTITPQSEQLVNTTEMITERALSQSVGSRVNIRRCFHYTAIPRGPLW